MFVIETSSTLSGSESLPVATRRTVSFVSWLKRLGMNRPIGALAQAGAPAGGAIT